MAAYDYAVVGGGIVGLAVAWALAKREPRARLLVLEKEETWARHQTGRNSGVIHAGIYYQPGTLKARLAREGNRMMVSFCREQGIRHEVCGKLVVATVPEEQPLLEKLYRRAQENGIEVKKLVAEQVREIEPHVKCIEGIQVPSSGIVDFREVCLKLAEMLAGHGTDLRLGTELTGVVERGDAIILKTSQGDYETKFLINCAGLQSDRVVRMTGAKPVARIVPFRGEYYELVPERRSLVRHLIYPVPNPRFPFWECISRG
jgi:(S)-2-hydroxyglutarate dehydrogenase